MAKDEQNEHFEDGLNEEETTHACQHWTAWAQHDLRFFVDPMAEKTGLTRAEVLLYLVSERLAQIAEQGVEVRLTARHDIHQHPPDDEEGEEPWKRGAK